MQSVSEARATKTAGAVVVNAATVQVNGIRVERRA